ncbi:MAG: phosphoglycerate kinase [Patescibacteria group bacterium]|jgi:phosphoglycerate kinase|nr:phosphoglycerate kinase [Patescibacteria group bacterium]
MRLKSLKPNLHLIKGQLVFLRLDLNLPQEKGKIKEDFKIQQSLATINLLLQNDNRLIIASHLGQPKNGFDSKYSLRPVINHLAKNLNQKIFFFDYQNYSKWTDVRRILKSEKDVKIFALDNLRFYPGEERDCRRLAKSFASLAPIYVNEAFAVSHRANSSISAILDTDVKAYAGLLLEAEINNLNKILSPKKPLVVVMGGAKISTKLAIIKKLLKIADYVLIGGALANNFFQAQGFETGKSLVDDFNQVELLKLLKTKKIILPSDVVVKSNGSKVMNKRLEQITEYDNILDLGPQTLKLFSEYIKSAQTIVWNGPLGYFEKEEFRSGTLNLAKAIAKRSKAGAFSLVGGGETVAAVNLAQVKKDFDWVSTGGGAMLSYLSGQKMPGIN